MKAILYLSTLTEDLSRDELKEIQTKSAIKNKALGVSGYLYFDGAKFLQYIEGEEDTLMPLVKLSNVL